MNFYVYWFELYFRIINLVIRSNFITYVKSIDNDVTLGKIFTISKSFSNICIPQYGEFVTY